MLKAKILTLQTSWKKFTGSTKNTIMLRLSLFLLLAFFFVQASPLQDAIDRAPIGATLELSAGKYLGNIYIDKPLSIIAKDDGVFIDGNFSGNTISINSSYVTLKNLNIINSGRQMHTLDSAVLIKEAAHITISHCKIKNSLYGINMYMVEDSNISNNTISSIQADIQLKGDGLKVWHSHNNTFANNTLREVRDATFNYSHNNTIKNNTFSNNRLALQFGMSHNNKIINNTFKYNSSSLVFMGGMDTNVSNNAILSSKGSAGIGLLVKDVKNFHFENNRVSFNGVGIYIDSKSLEMGMQRYFIHNTITYNKEALHFHKDIQNNTLINNTFVGNIDDVVKNTQQNTTFSNTIHHNYWDRYEGFDKNGDNIGDRAFKMYIYADQLWQYDHRLKFFYASPMISILNFISELTPVIEPVLILEDSAPFMIKE